ncbi:UEV-domain-containing protein [Wallemia mellicola]|uniref:UEV-domain-containing protein n=1 Tax=Wallemia mellicola TaxID=1708541 RepID=A0AB38N1Q4_9BASI|nr:UEV-domain-containing protein [Wallemia mellicola]TIC57129.1 UEV-domain-containing protein [Wallemia mellicola]TIC71007.1 UEV-domain-containing protein [Wallemia mellicola]
MISTIVSDWLKQVTSHYKHREKVFNDVSNLLASYQTLSPRTEVYIHDNGVSELLLNLHGVLPIYYRGVQYNIPISFWIPHNYPEIAPWVYVVPTSSMLVKSGNGVDASGLINLDYVKNWHKKPEAFNLVDLSLVLRNSFEINPPLYAKSTETQQQQQTQGAQTGQTTPSRPHKPPSISLSQSSVSDQPAHRHHTLTHEQTPSTSRVDSPPRRPPPPHSINQISSPVKNVVTSDTADLLTTEPDSIPHTAHTIPDEIKPAPTRPLNPNTVKLHATIHAIFSQKVSQSLENHGNLYNSQLTLKSDLERAKDVINDEQSRLKSVNEICKSVALKVNETTEQGLSVLENGRRKGEIGVDEIVCGDNLVANQLVDLIAEDRAIEDTMYHLGRALNAGRVDLERALRTIRELSREQFFKRALIKKIQNGLESRSDYMVNSDQNESFHQ